MVKLNRPENLIGYHTIDSIESGKPFKLSVRQKAYSVLMILLLGLMVTLGFMRSSVECTVLRSPGTLYMEEGDGSISNLYKIQVVNKTFEDLAFDLDTDFEGARIKLVGDQKEKHLGSSEEREWMFFIIIPRESIDQLSTKVKVYLRSTDGKLLDKETTTFLGPMTKSKS
jgi:hypothetical protein